MFVEFRPCEGMVRDKCMRLCQKQRSRTEGKRQKFFPSVAKGRNVNEAEEIKKRFWAWIQRAVPLYSINIVPNQNS